MVLTSSGLVLTNNHVIDGATSIQVQIDGTGPTYSATVVGYDVTHDVALLQMQNVSGLKAIPVGDSSKVAVNDPVVAIGNALGRSGPPAVTQGSVSALNQSITANDTSGNSETLNGTIQINAPIQPGDSGGALVNTSGQVIGMNTAAAGGYRQYSASSVAFAIPINSALSIARQIQAGQGSATIHIGVRGVLGVQVQPASAGNGNPFGGASNTSGAPIVGVASGSPAASAGLVAGDVITSVGSKTITSVGDLQPALDPYHPGDRVNISWVDSAGQHHSATLSLMAGPPA
jgi:S1-C subfamily serine protease